jgi:hydroxysqualene synthase
MAFPASLATNESLLVTYSDPRTHAAYAECRGLAARHYENFPVASWLVPSDKRDALAVIYAFSRCADDFADEPGMTGRLTALAEWRSKLAACFAGAADHPVFIALADVVRRFSLSYENFNNLICAFESDIRINRQPDFASLLAYCRCSANPVGRLVLELFGHRNDELFSLSDSICTALQLTNFWQDTAIDLGRDRIYLPLEELAKFGLSVSDLKSLMGSRDSIAPEALLKRWQDLMAFQVQRTRELFEHGSALPEQVAPELRRQLRMTWLGGVTILARIESVCYDVFRQRPALSKLDFFRLYFKARHARGRAPLTAERSRT